MAVFRGLSNCFLLLALLWAGPAWANIDKAGASRLKNALDRAVQEWTLSAEKQGHELRLDGPLMVEPSGNYYAVTIPGIKIGDMDGARIEMGMLAINAMPAAMPGQWKMTAAIPTPLTWFDQDQAIAGHMTIGTQNFAGIWDETLLNFAKLSAQYTDIATMDAQQQPTASIKHATVNIDIADNGKGDWSGPMEIELREVALARSGSKSSVGRVVLRGDMTDYSLQAAKEFDAKRQALRQIRNDKGTGSNAARPSGDHIIATYNMMIDSLASGFEKYDFSIAVEDYAVQVGNIDDAEQRGVIIPPRLQFKKLEFGLSSGGFRSGNVFINLRAGHEGLKMDPPPTKSTAMFPQYAHLDLSLNDLPFHELSAVIKNSLQSVVDTPQRPMVQMAVLGALLSTPELLTKSGSNLAIRKSRVGNAHYDITLDAVALADMNAQRGATAKARLDIRGVEWLMAQARAIIDNPATPANQRESMQRRLDMLTILQLMGTKSADAQNVVYDVTVEKDGRVIMNGSDVTSLLPPPAAKTEQDAPKAAP